MSSRGGGARRSKMPSRRRGTPGCGSDSGPDCGTRGGTRVGTLRGIVGHYIATFRDRARQELDFFASQPTLEDAVRKAAHAEDERGKRLGHQCRIPGRVLKESAYYLTAALAEIKAARTFEALHEVVQREILGIHGIGALTVYDTTLRIAAWLRLEPARVFLHAGTRVGARRLGLEATCESVAIRELPAPLRSLRPSEIEDVLCIYKDEFGAAVARGR